MRDWNSEVRRNRDVLKRIVALLVALADLADLAKSLPAFRRRHLLEILMYGEAEARAFVTAMATDAMPLGAPLAAPIWAGEPEPEGDPAGDPARLAASFRVLALVLWAMLARASQFALRSAAAPRSGRHKPALPAATRHQAALPARHVVIPALRHLGPDPANSDAVVFHRLPDLSRGQFFDKGQTAEAGRGDGEARPPACPFRAGWRVGGAKRSLRDGVGATRRGRWGGNVSMLTAWLCDAALRPRIIHKKACVVAASVQEPFDMLSFKTGLTLILFAAASPAFASSTTVNVKLWDKNGTLNPDARMGMGMPSNMSAATMRVELDKKIVPAGKVTFDVRNASSDTVHEMIVVPVADIKKATLPYVPSENRVDEDAAGHLGEVSELDPGKTGSLTLDLKPGDYAVFCNLPDHFMNGMWATIQVR